MDQEKIEDIRGDVDDPGVSFEQYMLDSYGDPDLIDEYVAKMDTEYCEYLWDKSVCKDTQEIPDEVFNSVEWRLRFVKAHKGDFELWLEERYYENT